eukprot:g18677.t1
MSRFSGLVNAFCGGQIDKEVEMRVDMEKMKAEVERLRKENDEAGSPVSKQWVEHKWSEKQKEMKDKHDAEIILWQDDINNKMSQLEELKRSKEGAEAALLEANNRMATMDADHAPDGMQRAFEQDWDGLLQLEMIKREKDEPRWVSDKHRATQMKINHPPKMANKPLREFSEEIYNWALKLYPLGNTMAELGQEILDNSFEGVHHEKQRATAAGPDLIAIMKRLTRQISPLVENVEHALDRYLPKVSRRKNYTPMDHYHIMQDIYDLEKKVCGNQREDKNMWERTISSMLLDKHAETSVRGHYKTAATNNFENLGTTLQLLNCEDRERYEYMTTSKVTGDQPDFLGKVFTALGEGTIGLGARKKVANVNEFYKSIGVRGVSFFGGGQQGGAGTSTPAGGATPRGAPGGGGGNNKKQYTDEEIAEMKKTKCQLGKKCFNLLKTGGCLFNHSKDELKYCKEVFERDFPEKAAARQKRLDGLKNKNKGGAAGGTADNKDKN